MLTMAEVIMVRIIALSFLHKVASEWTLCVKACHRKASGLHSILTSYLSTWMPSPCPTSVIVHRAILSSTLPMSSVSSAQDKVKDTGQISRFLSLKMRGDKSMSLRK
jgi:hypothetical protein